jgi:hypothetical protein
MGYSFIPHLNNVFIKLIISCASFISFYLYQVDGYAKICSLVVGADLG